MKDPVKEPKKLREVHMFKEPIVRIKVTRAKIVGIDAKLTSIYRIKN